SGGCCGRCCGKCCCGRRCCGRAPLRQAAPAAGKRDARARKRDCATRQHRRLPLPLAFVGGQLQWPEGRGIHFPSAETAWRVRPTTPSPLPPKRAPESPLARRALIPGPRIVKPEEVGSHTAIREKLRLALREKPSQPTDASEAIRLGARVGLDDPLQPRLDALRQWTQSAPVAMPTPWKAQLTRYERWSSIG